MTNEELLQQHMDGDASALEQLYEQNIGLIKRIAERCLMDFGYLPLGEKFPMRMAPAIEDLRQELFSEGTLAFCEQIQSGTYNPSRSKLTTYLYSHIRGAMYRWLEKYQNERVHTTFVSNLTPDREIEEPSELVDQQSLSVDRIVYQKICLEYSHELFNELSDKDKSILGHSFGVYGYEKYSLDELGLKEMLTVDGVIKAQKAALRHLQALYTGSKLQTWRHVHRLLAVQ